MSTLRGKTAIITGASRGIGLAIAIKYVSAGANVVIMSKDTPAHNEAAMQQLSVYEGHAWILDVDVTDCEAIKRAVQQTVERFGGIDILVNNTSATCFADTLHTTVEQFDTVVATSARAAFFMSQSCIPHLKNASNPHIINISPPLYLESQHCKNYLAFSLGKYAMSLCTLGMSTELQCFKIAVNSLWPKTTIATQTIKDHFLPSVYKASRMPSIMADAALLLALRESTQCTGHFFTDEQLLRENGEYEFSQYAIDPNTSLMQALFIPLEEHLSHVSQAHFLVNQAKEE